MSNGCCASDVDAIVRDHAGVQARLLADRANPEALRQWARALRSLQRHPHIWHDRINPATVKQLVELATGAHQVTGEQLTLLP